MSQEVSANNTWLAPFLIDTMLSGRIFNAIAKQVHEIFADVDTEEFRDELAWASCHTNKRNISARLRCGSGCLMITSWHNIDLYARGTMGPGPCLVSVPFTEVTNMDGLVYFKRSGMSRRSLRSISLIEATWAALADDNDFWGYAEQQ